MTDYPRSQNLLRWASTTGGNSSVLTCPADHVLLLKELRVDVTATATVLVTLLIGQPGGVTMRAAELSVEAGVSAWSAWLALNPGDYAYVNAGAGPVAAWLSGTVLSGAPRLAPASSAGDAGEVIASP